MTGTNQLPQGRRLTQSAREIISFAAHSQVVGHLGGFVAESRREREFFMSEVRRLWLERARGGIECWAYGDPHLLACTAPPHAPRPRPVRRAPRRPRTAATRSSARSGDSGDDADPAPGRSGTPSPASARQALAARPLLTEAGR